VLVEVEPGHLVSCFAVEQDAYYLKSAGAAGAGI
jgi:hypothetical protein